MTARAAKRIAGASCSKMVLAQLVGEVRRVSESNLVYFWNGTGWQHVPTPEPVRAITDHYILGAFSNGIYEWTGPSSGSTGTWSPQPIANSRYFVKIAWSQAIAHTDTPEGTIGHSQLWAFDTSGEVYNVQMISVGPIP